MTQKNKLEKEKDWKQEYLFEPIFSVTIGTMLEIDWSDLEYDEVFDHPRVYIVTDIREPQVINRTTEKLEGHIWVDMIEQITLRMRREPLEQLNHWYHTDALRIIHKP